VVVTIGIGAIRTVLPDKSVAVAELPEIAMLDPAAADFVAGCGIDTVAVFDAATGAGNAELATLAASRLVGDLSADPDVLIMVAPRAPDVLLGSDVCRVQADTKLAGTFAFTVDGLGCTGSSAAWALAGDLLRAQPARESVLIVHASLPAGVDRVRYPVTVIGDGAYAMTMVRGGRPTLKAHRMATDGTFHDLFHVDYKTAPWYEWTEVCSSPDRYRFELAMHSRLRLSAMVDEVLAEAGLAKEDIKATLMQNVTASAYQFYESLLGLPIHPVCRDNLGRYGHLGAMDVVLNLQRLIETGEAGEGDHVLVLNNSPVAAWAASLWEF
jgi:3-oxoacyl-[acyl-carrier-protein] synthase-3